MNYIDSKLESVKFIVSVFECSSIQWSFTKL